MHDIRYADSSGYRIAYQVVGDGPRDLVLVHGWVTNLELLWEYPPAARAGAAAPGEVLATQTVRDLVAGSGLRFVDRGPRSFQGVPDPLRVAVAEA